MKKNIKIIVEKPLHGIDRSFAVLDLIASQPSRVVDVTKALNLPWATVHRTIKNLEKSQFLVKNSETSRYEIGPRMWHIGSSYLANNKVLNSALSYLSAGNQIKNVDIQIVERIGNYSVVIHAQKRQSQKISKAQYGFHLPLHAGSKGLVLLAFESKEFIDAYLDQDLEKITSETITDKGELQHRLSQVREDYMASTVGDVQPHTGSVAAPIFNINGNVVGCVCFVFMKNIALKEHLIGPIKESLALMSNAISSELGWHRSLNGFSAAF